MQYYKKTSIYGLLNTSAGGANDVGVLFEWNPATNSYTKKADFTGANGANPAYGALVVYDAPDTTPPTTRINAGGTTQTVSGVTWSGCSGVGNCNSYVTGGFAYTQSGTYTVNGLAAPLNQAIFQTEWTGGVVGQNPVPQGQVAFSYNIPVVNGTYLIRLHFAELNKNGVGLRVFDVNIEGGAKELVNFDIFKEVGYRKATSKEFAFNITDGAINIDFIRQIENAKISAIEIIPVTPDTQAPTAPVLSLGTVTTNSVALNWSGATDNVAVTAYEIFNGATLITTTSNNSFNITGLTANTAYAFTVKAKDAAGNSSAASNVINATTLALPTSVRFEAETNYTIVSNIGTNGNTVPANNNIASAGKDLRAYDIGDKFNINFNVTQSGQYRLKVRNRSGWTASPRGYWTPAGYAYKLNGATTSFVGNTSTVSSTPTTAYGSVGATFGTMESGIVNLDSGSHTLQIEMLRSWLGVDYLEVEFLGSAGGVAHTNPTENAVETRESITLAQDISKIYPNPSNGDVYVEFSGGINGKVEYSITDAQGKVITKQAINLDEPQYVIKIAIANLRLSQGVYYLYIKGDKLLEKTIRFVKN